MKLSLIVLAVAAYVATALPVEDPNIEYPRLLNYVGDDGKNHTIDLEEKPDMRLLSEITRNPAHNRYFLYTRRNPHIAQELVYRRPGSIWESDLDISKPTVVIAHGWLNNQASNINSAICDAFFVNHDVNVIVVEWRKLAVSGYVTAATGVPAVGKGVGQFLNWLHENSGLKIEHLHLVGFSLGAHVVGNAGRYLHGKVARVTGLDPAGPLWHYNSDRLSAADGRYVEAIHTNGGVAGLGIGKQIAHADFFPNGGSSQPGCLTPICDHNRAWEFFASSVKYNHMVANECMTNLQLKTNRCSGRQLPMGNSDLDKWGTGTYRVNTKRKYPY